jgi:hypothetical protein
MAERILYWFPRLLTILALLFMLMFSFDIIGMDGPLTKKLRGLLIHNIPVFVLAAILIISWKREMTGGILFIAAFIAASIYFRSFSGNPGSLVVILPFLITGILFILHHVKYSKSDTKKTSDR